MPLPLLRAYIDETGDRGHSGKSSAFFAFAAVLVADEDEGDLRAAMSKLRRNLSVPAARHCTGTSTSRRFNGVSM